MSDSVHASERRSNLPVQMTSFIGRRREVPEIAQLLRTTRLLTLTGPGGSGKTRLALKVAGDLLDSHNDGVWLVELAPLSDSRLVAQAVASSLGLRDGSPMDAIDGLIEHLRAKVLCLLLDNCEHLIEVTAALADRLLRACPDLRILATSREPLGIAGETIWQVAPLPVPPASIPEGEYLKRVPEYEAAQLFVERALAARSGFRVTEQNARALAEVCRRLDGIPLAIELAATRVRVFSVEQIAARLDDRFRLLTSGQRTAMPRHQTLRATVEWSHNLLSEVERALLRRLSVFAGSWSFEAAEAVATGHGVEPHAVTDLLGQLVDKSLVLSEERRGVARYALPETIREFAGERLRESGEQPRARGRHLAHYLWLAEDAESRLRGAEERVALDRLAEEYDNLRVALEWSLTQPSEGDEALRLSSALSWFWYLRGPMDEGLGWLTRALTSSPERTSARMKALHGAGWLAHHLRDSAAARELLEESLAIARAEFDRPTVAWVLQVLGRVAYFENDAAAARALGDESLAVSEELGDDWLIAYALHLLGLAAYIAGENAAAWSHYERSLAIRRELQYEEGVGILLTLMGLVALREGDLAAALRLQRESLGVLRAAIGPWSVSMSLAGVAYVAASSAEPALAARLASAARTLVEKYRTPMIPLFEPALATALEMARENLGEARYSDAVERGRTMPLDEVIAEALALDVVSGEMDLSDGAHVAAQSAAFPSLTPSETHVLRLLTTGQTTKEIAAALVVAVSTVDRHLTHIYQKLGVRNRAEAVAMALRDGMA